MVGVPQEKNGILEDELSDVGYQYMFYVYRVWSLSQAANPSTDQWLYFSLP